MREMVFNAYAVTNEIDLNKIAAECNIPKKYTWEEPLILQGDILGGIIQRKLKNDEKVLIFSFGSVVFINMDSSGTLKFLEYLKKFKTDIDLKNWNAYSDDYELHVGGAEEMELTDKYVIVPRFEMFYPELISTVLAKSVALEKTEEQLGGILDKLETMIDNLEKGSLRIGNKQLARTIARVTRHEYNTINYIMILDKPDITWVNSDAEEFYNKMAEFFELNDRFEIMKSKTNILNNIVGGFSSISHSIRGLFVEWVIVILIIIEVLLMVVDMFK
ncbi:MAG TPA: RMD1 family protein [Clostridiaceae bacterium]|nr:RMD1 family protein [Clostridiaceae bacterium]